MSFSQTQVFAADGGVAESSQSGTPQGEGEVFFLTIQMLLHTLDTIRLALLMWFLF